MHARSACSKWLEPTSRLRVSERSPREHGKFPRAMTTLGDCVFWLGPSKQRKEPPVKRLHCKLNFAVAYKMPWQRCSDFGLLNVCMFRRRHKELSARTSFQLDSQKRPIGRSPTTATIASCKIGGIVAHLMDENITNIDTKSPTISPRLLDVCGTPLPEK
jgi:hypothetical protein